MLDETLCTCGVAGCWDRDDYSWRGSASGWSGEINGCQSAVFFIHGRMIREQRHIPYGTYEVADLPRLVAYWSEGLPNAQLRWLEDSGDGYRGLWIEGVRAPHADDLLRLEQARSRERQNDLLELERITARLNRVGA